ncbi:MAG: HD domain-containing protein [Thermoleophilia bacterium]|nr:HD domain-containing protein [Thermoleophilia bacterium]
MNARLMLFSYVSAVATAATLGVAGLLATTPPIELAGPLLGLAVLGEELAIRQRRRAAAAVLSLSAPAHIAAAIALGPLPAALVAIFALIIVDGPRSGPRRWLVLNASMFGLAAAASGLAYQAAGGGSTPKSAVALVALLGVRFLTTSTVLTIGGLLAAPKSIGFVVSEVAADEARAAVGDGSLGVLIAYGISGGHWIVLPFLLPLVVAVYRSRATYEQLEHETRAALDSVAAIVDERHRDTAAHSDRVKELVDEFLRALQIPERQRNRLVLAARLHDIGKINVDAATLSKDEPLTAAELSAIRGHPKLSARLLRSFRFASEFASFVELHHERFDGNGYYGVPADVIPIESHLLIVADSFDAMTSRRPYRPALTQEEAVAEILDKAGTQFHPLVARAFVGLLTENNIGAELNENELKLLRSEFGRDWSPVLALARKFDLRSTAVLAVAVGLLSMMAAPTTTVVVVTLLPALGALSYASVRTWQSARHGRRINDILRHGDANPLAALRAAQLINWVVWLHIDESGRQTAAHTFGDPPTDVGSLCGWAARREDFVVVPVEQGHAVLTRPTEEGNRVAIGFPNRPTEADQPIIDCIEAIPEPEVGSKPNVFLLSADRKRTEEATVLLLNLRMFDRVRRAAGQLVAGRVADDATRALEASLRAEDRIVRLSADEIGISVARASTVETVERRLRDALRGVPVPARVGRIDPLIMDVTDRPEGERVRNTLGASRLTESAEDAV